MIVPNSRLSPLLIVFVVLFQEVYALPSRSSSAQNTDLAPSLQPRATIYSCPESLATVIERALNVVKHITHTAITTVAASIPQEEHNAPLRNLFAYHFGTNDAFTKLRVWQQLNAVRREAEEDPGRLPIMCQDIEGRCNGGTSAYLDRTETIFVMVCVRPGDRA
ncbi:MAG: hypothetical protein Q9160_008899 [Pyrenula sp. 1 TL-2023]